MELAAYVTGLVLAGFFALAGVAKLGDRAKTAAGFAQLGVPVPATAAVVVPGAELVSALALVLVPVAGGVLGLVVLGAFTTFLADRLHRGVVAPCGCFGGSHDDPLAWTDVLRNGAFCALALVVVLVGPTTAPFLG